MMPATTSSDPAATGPGVRTSVSVVICTRNRPEMLRHLLASVLSRGSRPDEVLVVDSASAEPTTREVAEEAGVGYVRADRPGLSIARNLGLRSCDSDIVVFTDDDCEVAADWIQALVGRFADWRVGAVSGRMLDPGAPATLFPDHHRRTYLRTVQGLDAGHGALMAFDRRAVLELGGFDEVLGAGKPLAGAEDLDMFCRVLRAGWSVVHEPAAAVIHLNQRQGDDYTKLLRGYGLGLGAMIGKFLRIDRTVGAHLAVVVLRRTTLRSVRMTARRNPRAKGDWAMLAGVLTGMARALALPIRGERFVDGRRGSK